MEKQASDNFDLAPSLFMGRIELSREHRISIVADCVLDLCG